MSSNTFNYILENIQGGLQKQIVIKLAIMAGIVQSTVCRINKQAKKNNVFFKIEFLNIRFQTKVTIP